MMQDFYAESGYPLDPDRARVAFGRDNVGAQSLYRSAGFENNGRQLLTLQLAPAAHEESPGTRGEIGTVELERWEG